MSIQGHLGIEKCMANDLVRGVMASDVFANRVAFSTHIEDPGSMNSACVREITLRITQFFRERKQRFDIDPEICRCYRWKILPDRLDACFAAKTATAGNCSESFLRIQLNIRIVLYSDVHSVIDARGDMCDLPTVSHDCLRKQKPGCEFCVVTWRTHGDGNRLASDANFQGLLDCQLIGQILQLAIAFSPNDLLRINAAFFHVKRLPSMLS